MREGFAGLKDWNKSTNHWTIGIKAQKIPSLSTCITITLAISFIFNSQTGKFCRSVSYSILKPVSFRSSRLFLATNSAFPCYVRLWWFVKRKTQSTKIFYCRKVGFVLKNVATDGITLQCKSIKRFTLVVYSFTSRER